MESKGRRASRAAGPSATPVEIAAPSETPPATAKPVDSPPEELTPVDPPAEVAVPITTPKNASSDDLGDFGRETFAALVQAQTAVARGLGALSAEMAGLALSGIDAAARTATDMLGVKTLSDAIEVNAGFTRSSFDTFVGGSAKLSELGVRLASEASQPILTQLGKSWIKAARLAF
jgi:hypothetical protein